MTRRMITLLVALMCASAVCARHRPALRIVNGVTDTEGKYPYVVCLLIATVNRMDRLCTGSLVTSEWVITAAHCLNSKLTHIQYGNMSVFPIKSQTVSPILKQFPHPNYYTLPLRNDIALVLVRPVPMKVFGVLSAVDYNTLLGRAVEFAGYGSTQKTVKHLNLIVFILDAKRPLQLGEGVVTSCSSAQDKQLVKAGGPYMCVTSKCSNNQQVPDKGDSGGPLFYGRKIVGVASFVTPKRDMPVVTYTAISPSLSWINKVMNTK